MSALIYSWYIAATKSGFSDKPTNFFLLHPTSHVNTYTKHTCICMIEKEKYCGTSFLMISWSGKIEDGDKERKPGRAAASGWWTFFYTLCSGIMHISYTWLHLFIRVFNSREKSPRRSITSFFFFFRSSTSFWKEILLFRSFDNNEIVTGNILVEFAAREHRMLHLDENVKKVNEKNYV